MSEAWDRDEAGVFVETLFAKHHGEIYAYLLRMMRDPEVAADMAQDAFIKAYKNYETLEKPENARAWLYQIAHRVALDEIRRRKIIRFFPWTGESRGSAPSAEHLVMDARLSGDMQRALARIPERQRAALLLAELHDLTGLELAAALGVSHVAARALLTRARESLRQALAAEREAEATPRPTRRRPDTPGAHRRAAPMSRFGRVAAPARPLVLPARARPVPGRGADRRSARAGRGRLARRAPRRLCRLPGRRRRVRRRPAGAARAARHHARAATRPVGAHGRRHRAGGRSGRRCRRRVAVGVLALAARRAVRDRRRRGRARGHRRCPAAWTAVRAPAASTTADAECQARPSPPPPRRCSSPPARSAGSTTIGDGGYAYNVAPLDEVCPMGDQPDCAALGEQTGAADRPGHRARSRSSDRRPTARPIVVGQDRVGATERLRRLPAQGARRDPAAEADPDPTPTPTTSTATARPTASTAPSPTAAPSETSDPQRTPPPTVGPTAEPTQTAEPTATDGAESGRDAVPTPSGSEPPTPEPTVALKLAIASDVTVVGQSAAFSRGWRLVRLHGSARRRLGRPGHLRLARRRRRWPGA